MSLHVGRVTLIEPHDIDESGDQVRLSGREAWPVLDRDEVLARHADVLRLPGALVPLRWGVKCARDGYYTVTGSSSTLTDLRASGTADWSLTLTRYGSDGEVDLESRLTGAVRANDFSLTGERWHAPAIGAYAYYTGSTSPSSMTRDGEDGTITVYRGVPSGVSPRWGCAAGDYLAGRVRIRAGFPGREVSGLDVQLDPDAWELSNGLVRARRLFTAASLEVGSYTGGAWRPKGWQVDIGSGAITSFDAASVLRNDPECAIVRLTYSRDPSRATVDLTLRRGSRVVEVYAQRGSSGAVSVYLAAAETMTDSTSYVVASAEDDDGNLAIAGSAKNFDAHDDGGVAVSSAAALDCWLGVVAGGSDAVDGDQATDLRDQYIGTLPEIVAAVRR